MLVFVSYARRDLGLARLVQRELDEQGIATWLDVSELRPGSDWSDEISDALRSSDALVLVASQTSLGSVHCAHEWRSALANAARVVLAVVEPVTLPEELRAQPAVDLRRVGRPRWEELADALRHGTAAPAHATPSIDRLRLPTPFRIAGLALALLLAFQVALVADVGRRALDLLAEGPSAAAAALVIGHVAILVLWIAFTTRWSWRFLRRDGTTNALLGMLAVPVLWILHAVFAGPDAGVFGIFVSLGLFALVMPAAGVELQAWAPATRHRRRRGSAGEAVDEALADDSRPSPPAPDRPAVSYALHFAPQDELVAERINDVMSRRELRPAGPGEPADVHLLVLSNATDAALAAQATRAAHGARTICLVITTIAVPDDLGVFHRHQWLDLRRAGGEELDRLTAWLRDPSTAQPPSVATDPVGLTRLLLPVDANIVVGFLVVVAAVLGFAVLQPTLQATHDPSSDFPGPAELVPALGGAALAAATAAAVRVRALTYRWFVAAYLATCALALAWMAASGSELAGHLLLVAPAAGVFLTSRRELRRWLPARPLPRRRPLTLAPEPVLRAVLRQGAGTLAATVAAAVIVSSGDALDR